MNDVAKCNLTDCEKFDNCMYGQSKLEVVYDFKYYCFNCDKYCKAFPEGQSYRETIVEEVMEIES